MQSYRFGKMIACISYAVCRLVNILSVRVRSSVRSLSFSAFASWIKYHVWYLVLKSSSYIKLIYWNKRFHCAEIWERTTASSSCRLLFLWHRLRFKVTLMRMYNDKQWTKQTFQCVWNNNHTHCDDTKDMTIKLRADESIVWREWKQKNTHTKKKKRELWHDFLYTHWNR